MWNKQKQENKQTGSKDMATTKKNPKNLSANKIFNVDSILSTST
jgi:hypothetical protein